MSKFFFVSCLFWLERKERSACYRKENHIDTAINNGGDKSAVRNDKSV